MPNRYRSWTIRRLLVLLQTLCWCCLLSTLPLSSQQNEKIPFEPQLRPHVAHVSWTQRDGAPLNIAAIAQTDDGYLWLGSSFGLFRFDGVSFSHYPITQLDTPLPAAGVTALSSDGEGGLWIGYHRGGISHLTLAGGVSNYNPDNGRGPHSITKFVHRSDGSMWCLGDNKIYVFAGDRWKDFGSQAGLTDDQHFLLYFDRQGDLWTSTRGGLYVLRRGKQTFELYPKKTFIVVDMAEEDDGRLWISDGWRSIHPLEADEAGINVEGYVRLLYAEGTLWMAQDYRGLTHVRLTPGDIVLPDRMKESEISSEQTNAIFRDRDGSIWVGTAKGLDRFHSSILQEITNTRVEFYPSLAADDTNLVWIGMLAHPIIHTTGEDLTAEGPWLGSSPMVTDTQGRLWIVDPTKKALFSFGPNDFERFPMPPEVHGVDTQSIGLDRDGVVLVSFDGAGLWRFNGSWEKVVGKGLNLKDPLSIYRDATGSVWLGYPGEIILSDERGYRRIRDAVTLSIGSILTFQVAHGMLWVAGTNGVAYFAHGEFHRIGLAKGGALRGVSGIVEDALGNLWLNAGDGIIRIRAEEVQKVLHDSHHDLDFDLLDQRQGVDGIAPQLHSTPSAVVGRAGILWFSRLGTVFRIDPTQFFPSASSSKPLIESVYLNGIPVRDREHQAGAITVSAAHLEKLEFNYVGLDLVSPEKLTYQYMLTGEDKGWQDAGVSRQAFYSHLAPGTYQFRVRTTDGKQQWAELNQPLSVTIRPEFYQTLWYKVACIVLAAALLYALYLVRLGIVTSQLRDRMQVRSSERMRIARELHDTLLQAIHGLMLRVHFATETIPSDQPARSSLEQALKNADALILEGRKRVQDLREEIPEELEFDAQITSIAQELDLVTVSAFRIVEEGIRRRLHTQIQAELCRVAREALRNSRYHAQASVIEVHLTYEEGHFLMKCCDNGIGMPSSVVMTGNRPGHWGLASMRERVSLIGGQLQVWSAPEGGTEVIVKLSARKAYEVPISAWSRMLGTLHLARNTRGTSKELPKDDA